MGIQIKDGPTWKNLGQGVDGGLVPISKTYDELKALRDGSLLIPGRFYRITDFRTIYKMPTGMGVSATYICGRVGDPVETPVEPLIVFAVSSNALSGEAYSESYPQDRIQYDMDGKPVVEVLGGAILSAGLGTGWDTIETGDNNAYVYSPTGTGAAVTITIVDGYVTAVTVNNPGVGYTTADTWNYSTFSGPITSVSDASSSVVSKGAIMRREDTAKNIIFFYDWRAVRFSVDGTLFYTFGPENDLTNVGCVYCAPMLDDSVNGGLNRNLSQSAAPWLKSVYFGAYSFDNKMELLQDVRFGEYCYQNVLSTLTAVTVGRGFGNNTVENVESCTIGAGVVSCTLKRLRGVTLGNLVYNLLFATGYTAQNLDIKDSVQSLDFGAATHVYAAYHKTILLRKNSGATLAVLLFVDTTNLLTAATPTA